MTVEQYLAFEEASDVRHEYVDGYVYAMTGGSLRHNRIVLNIATQLIAADRGGRCEVFVNDVKVRVGESKFYYPDAVVVCGPVDLEDSVVRNPCLVVEVLSPGTRRTDRIAKVADYAEAGIGCYLLVEPGPPTVLTELRLRDGAYEQVADPTGTAQVALDGVAVAIDLAGMLDP